MIRNQAEAEHEARSWRFSHAIVRQPSLSVSAGLRTGSHADPDPAQFRLDHAAYVNALRDTGATIIELPPLENFPDSVFVEDPVLCLAGTAIVLRPGAPSRIGEAAAIAPSLETVFENVLHLPGEGFVDGGDLLATDHELFAGLSARTDEAGLQALTELIEPLGYPVRKVNTPPEILHFKTDCGLLDSNTIFSSRTLAATDCFDGYRVIIAPEGEEAAANLIRFNDKVMVSNGYPKTMALLAQEGYQVVPLANGEAEKIDGGLSCMSLRFSL